MIEFCTRRRMILSIIGLGLLTIIILILEETLTSDLGLNGGGTHLQNGSQFLTSSYSPHISIKTPNEVIPAPAPDLAKAFSGDSNTKRCWLTEDFQIERECSPCTKFEISSGTPLACASTGRKETIRCNKSGVVYRSCSVIIGLETRRFWIFESLMLLISVLAYGIVKFRWSQLERKAIKQIERRLANEY